jgi:uncharacterized membrane protein
MEILGPNGMREEEIVSQIKDPMNIKEQSPPHSGVGKEAQAMSIHNVMNDF